MRLKLVLRCAIRRSIYREPGTQLLCVPSTPVGSLNTDITQGLPRTPGNLEARNPKGEAVITEVECTVIEIEARCRARTTGLVHAKIDAKYVVPDYSLYES